MAPRLGGEHDPASEAEQARYHPGFAGKARSTIDVCASLRPAADPDDMVVRAGAVEGARALGQAAEGRSERAAAHERWGEEEGR